MRIITMHIFSHFSIVTVHSFRLFYVWPLSSQYTVSVTFFYCYSAQFQSHFYVRPLSLQSTVSVSFLRSTVVVTKHSFRFFSTFDRCYNAQFQFLFYVWPLLQCTVSVSFLRLTVVTMHSFSFFSTFDRCAFSFFLRFVIKLLTTWL